jgi:mono/diheme cytochrome c family protein
MLDMRLLLLPLFVTFGGWASLTLDDVPDYIVAGQPVTLTYMVRQHGVEPMSGLTTSVDARSGDRAATALAQASGRAGRYAATLTLHHAGDWTISINTGFWPKRVTLLPIKVIAPGAPTPVLADADRGQRLFLGKGCVTCHVHRDVPAEGGKYGPDLTGRHFPAEYLSQFLADPAKVLRARGSTREMPNLELKAREIAALVAFLNQDGQTVGRD